jgi:hypothetical protein
MARSEELREQERIEASWAETARRYNLRARAERRREWIDYHNDLARVHARLVEEHEAALRRLIDGKV